MASPDEASGKGYIYVAKDDEGLTIYVGQTRNYPWRRAIQHENAKRPWIPLVDHYETWAVPLEDLDRVEREEIEKREPAFNIKGNGPDARDLQDDYWEHRNRTGRYSGFLRRHGL